MTHPFALILLLVPLFNRKPVHCPIMTNKATLLVPEYAASRFQTEEYKIAKDVLSVYLAISKREGVEDETLS